MAELEADGKSHEDTSAPDAGSRPMMASRTGRLTAGRFSSSRIEMEILTSSNKTSARRTRKLSLRTSEQEWHPSSQPGWRLHPVPGFSEAFEPATRLMRIPVGGGPPEPVLSGRRSRTSLVHARRICVLSLRKLKASKS